MAVLTAAYAMLKCASVYAALCWSGSALRQQQIIAEQRYPTIDFQFWVRYGSWSQCPHCASFSFNDQYFRDHLYQRRATTEKFCPAEVYRDRVPSDPLVHADGHVGISSRWWYLAPMYKPVNVCSVCTHQFGIALRQPRGTLLEMVFGNSFGQP